MSEQQSSPDENEIDASGAPHSGIPRYSPGTEDTSDFDEYPYDDERFNRGVQHVVDLLAKTIAAPDTWHSGDGSEDYDDDLAETLRNILAARGLYDKETGDYGHPAQGSAVAWTGEYDGHLDTTIYRDTMERWKALGRKITPLYAVTPSPGPGEWTADQFWEYVGDLAGEFEAGQMRDMLAAKGLSITSTNRDGFGNKLCPKCSFPHSEFADCPAMAPADCGGAAE